MRRQFDLIWDGQMMEPLYRRERYGEVLAQKIEAMGATAVSIANRWSLGWPERVEKLIVSGEMLDQLQKQTEWEKDVLSEATGLQHLSRVEILQLHEVSLVAPLCNSQVSRGHS